MADIELRPFVKQKTAEQLGAAMITQSAASAQAALAGVKSAVDGDMSPTLLLVSDQTGVGADNWYYRFASETLPTCFPGACIRYSQFSDIERAYEGVETIQAGTLGQRRARFDNNCIRSIKKAGVIARTSPDIHFRVSMTADEWAPSVERSPGGTSGADLDRGYYLRLEAGGRISLYWSENGRGSTLKSSGSSPAVPFTDGDRITLDVSLLCDNGSGGYTCRILLFDDETETTFTVLHEEITSDAVTSVFESTVDYHIGGIFRSRYWRGDIYSFVHYNGIGGEPITPVDIESWHSEGTVFTGRIHNDGSPTIHVFNASIADLSLAELNDPARMPSMLVYGASQVVFVSSSHNDPVLGGKLTADAWAGMIQSIHDRCYAASIIAMSQNPRNRSVATSNAGYEAQLTAAHMIPMIAQRHGVGCIDMQAEFNYALEQGASIADLVPTGTVPGPQGVDVMLDTMDRHLKVIA